MISEKDTVIDLLGYTEKHLNYAKEHNLSALILRILEIKVAIVELLAMEIEYNQFDLANDKLNHTKK